MKKKNRQGQFEVIPPIPQEEKDQQTYSDFQESLKVVFGHEGGLSNNKFDKGGVTKYGISLRFLKDEGIDIDEDGDIDKDDILWLSKEQAEQLYYNFFYLRVKADKIKSRKVATHLFDIAVNSGVTRAGILIQKTLRNIGKQIKIDGVIGNITLGILNNADSNLVNKNLVDVRLDFYNQIVADDPSQVIFLNGWRNRANSFR